MQPENEARLDRIRKISRVLQAVCTLYILFCVLLFVNSVTGPIFRHGPNWGIGILWQGYNGVQFKVFDLTVRDRVLAAILFTLTCGFALLCGLQLFRLLGYYSRGEIFTRQSAGQIRRWGIACVALGIVKFVYSFVPLVIANSRRTQGPDLSLIVNGLIIVAISWFMEMAAEMREENELTV